MSNSKRLALLLVLYSIVLFTVLGGLNGVPTDSGGTMLHTRLEVERNASIQEAKLRKLVSEVRYLQRSSEVDKMIAAANVEHDAQRAKVYPNGVYTGSAEDSLHLFYTCDCTQHSLWQVLGLEWSWQAVKHPGAITRIVSGCVSETAVQHTNINLLKRKGIDHEKLFVFFAPKIDTSAVPGPQNTTSSYAPLNRPASVLFWLTRSVPPEDILCLLDPDMVFLKPLYYGVKVRPGRPAGQYYDYLISEDWDKQYLEICPDCPPLRNKRDFCPGPPHMMHRTDWVALSTYWVKYTIEARRVWGKWVSEMVGMSIGMAKLDLRSEIISDGMWDRPDAAEGVLKQYGLWDPSSIEPAKPVADHRPLGIHPVKLDGLPCMLHYCFTPEIGRKTYPESFWKTADPQMTWEAENRKPLLHYVHWSKYRVPGDWPGGMHVPPTGTILTCGQHLFFELPPVTYMIKKYGKTRDDKGWALMLSNILPTLNQAIESYKARYCGPGYDTRKLVRTAHPTFWLTNYEMSVNQSAKYGFVFRNIHTGAVVVDEE
eukprot:TRINITY_DN5631_c0_g1_i1.p1 TRINITY_DN5631_c0_g1~~TRINITY_DN5631_c0_g1_i1.p1  ORF type:complete len:540 (+),score=98.24 TRINITY_DN5631_c0_g1_i1:62-1681(+)